MKISIALCTFNGEKFLQEQLNSIAGQTRVPDELVVCDDVSSDSTLEILKAFKEKASFPVYIHQNKKNIGSTKNFEKAIRLCSGDIFALSDQDDVWKPRKLQKLEEVLQAHPDSGYVFSDAELVDENMRPLDHSLWKSTGFEGEIRRLFLEGEQFRCFIRKQFVTGATMAIRASVVRLAMPFPTTGHWIHDGWLALVSSATGSPGVPVDDTLISYRQHSNQQIGASGPEERQSLVDRYRELKANRETLFASWEANTLAILSLKEPLRRLRVTHPSPTLDRNLQCLRELETHFLSRRKALTCKNMRRYRLILREAFSGRYGQFSDSWRSIFRDLILNQTDA